MDDIDSQVQIWKEVSSLEALANYLARRTWKGHKILNGCQSHILLRWCVALLLVVSTENCVNSLHFLHNFTLSDLVDGPRAISYLCRPFHCEFCARLTAYTRTQVSTVDNLIWTLWLVGVGIPMILPTTSLTRVEKPRPYERYVS